MSSNKINKISEEIEFSDNATNFLTIWEGENNGLVRIILPAMGVRASYYDKFAEMVAVAKGGTCITTDLRGLGKYEGLKKRRRPRHSIKPKPKRSLCFGRSGPFSWPLHDA